MKPRLYILPVCLLFVLFLNYIFYLTSQGQQELKNISVSGTGKGLIEIESKIGPSYIISSSPQYTNLLFLTNDTITITTRPRPENNFKGIELKGPTGNSIITNSQVTVQTNLVNSIEVGFSSAVSPTLKSIDVWFYNPGELLFTNDSKQITIENDFITISSIDIDISQGLTITALPHAGWHQKSITADSYLTNTNGTLSIPSSLLWAIDQITVYFERDPQVNIILSAQGQGCIHLATQTGQNLTTCGYRDDITLQLGEVITLTAQPTITHQLRNWYALDDNGETFPISTQSILTLTVDEFFPTGILAEFSDDVFLIPIHSN